FHEKRQKDYGNKYDNLINGSLIPDSSKRTAGLYAHVAPSLSDPKAKRSWDLLRGWYTQGEIDVYKGTRAVGTVSVRWWQDLLDDMKDSYETALTVDLNSSSPAALAWTEAIRLIEKEIIPVLRHDLESHLEAGDWWWRVFEAINYKNYTSPEWWAKDWAFHKDWGTAVFKELN